MTQPEPSAEVAPACDHNCCGLPWHRSEDQWGGRTMPTRGQCDCACHESGAACPVHGQRKTDYEVRRAQRA